MIPFDDIDTDFKKGFEILEVLRKYITSGQIITILTGDLELYSKLVRKANWKCFDDDFLKRKWSMPDIEKRNLRNDRPIGKSISD